MLSTLTRFRQENPLVQQVDLLLPDLVGVPRGKRLSMDALERAAEGEILFSSTLYSLDTTGTNVDASPLVWEEGDADRPVALDAATLVPVPWRPTHAQVIGGLTEPDGTPFFADPRGVLRRVAGGFAELGLTPVAALEFEFYLLDGETAPDGRPSLPGAAAAGETPNIDVYRFERLDAQAEFFDLLDRYCDAQGIETKAAIAEFAPGQFEVNLAHGTDMLRAADAGLMFKRCVKAAARACGRRACFMAKPFSELAGSGLHVHLSLRDGQGRNLFGETAEGEAMLRRCVAGMQALMAESMAIFAPNANSYRRLQPLSYAPLAPSWGHNNRTVALRIPAGPARARRIEHRVAGADANPYLVLAAVLAGALHGLRSGGDPGEPVTGNAYEKVPPGLPRNWYRALAELREATHLPAYLGKRFCDLYLLCREAERERFESRVVGLDYAWYLDAV